VQGSPTFFRGSELPRLLVLATIVVAGWTVFWRFAGQTHQPEPAQVGATANPEPIVGDRSIEFETVTDRTPVGFRDNAAYALLLERARGRSAAELAQVSRRDIALAQIWQNPEMYRGVPIHLLGSALRVLRYPSKLSKTGWIHEASIITPDAPRNPYTCVFEEAPEGFPIGANVSERVVFNGYFLKIWKYEAGDVPRGAPLLVGKIGWGRSAPATTRSTNSTLWWSLVVLGVLFFISLGRWIYQLQGFFFAPRQAHEHQPVAATDRLDPAALDAWARSLAPQDESVDEDGEWDEG
jgi:hypothetical protein